MCRLPLAARRPPPATGCCGGAAKARRGPTRSCVLPAATVNRGSECDDGGEEGLWSTLLASSSGSSHPAAVVVVGGGRSRAGAATGVHTPHVLGWQALSSSRTRRANRAKIKRRHRHRRLFGVRQPVTTGAPAPPRATKHQKLYYLHTSSNRGRLVMKLVKLPSAISHECLFLSSWISTKSDYCAFGESSAQTATVMRSCGA